LGVVTSMTDSVPLFPVFLKLEGRPVLVVGGGRVAAGKIEPLLSSGAHVVVVAPNIAASIETMGDVRVVRREYVTSDLDGVWLVVAAATPEVNRHVAADAAEQRIFVNAVDDPRNASAYLGGVVRRAGVTCAISTNGRAPALAGILREGLDAVLPDDLHAWVAEADRLRLEWKANAVPMERRRPQLLAALLRRYDLEP